MTQKQWNIAILMFDDVEVLDFAGPFEVFGVARYEDGSQPFNVCLVSEDGKRVIARNGLKVDVDYGLSDCPKLDLLLIPGGQGTRTLMYNENVQAWIQSQYDDVEHLLTVCTGSLVVAKTGLLSGLAATTYHTAFDLLTEAEPTLEPRPGERWVDNGKIITSAGVSAGIDMALHTVSRLLGKEFADQTARFMEYEYWSVGQFSAKP
jgi:transcriptional regulator GlxA family with amidase domain